VLDVVYALLHPFMPFVTEELWTIKGEDGPPRAGMLALGPWPRPDFAIDRAAEAEIGWIVELVSEIRSVRSEVGVPAGSQLTLTLVQASSSIARIVEAWGDTIKRLARIVRLEFAETPPAGSLPIVVRDALAALPLAGIVDIEAEKSRLDKEIARERQEIAKVDAKLANPDFVARAPEEIIAEHHERREASLSRIAKMEAARSRLDRI
jgi:valyl-tRNA synthetase